ncbi:hypothetical protein [Anaeromassilibacillus sp. An200]|uniref:hypothetical protein n=1 Tax=Anaeromassilibacillus sp. An200 TaxID=1965587 RepID=UPI0013A661F7|nr:hypothetical protein [Anaeromassilibacillus sp. An200]
MKKQAEYLSGWKKKGNMGEFCYSFNKIALCFFGVSKGWTGEEKRNDRQSG